MTVPNSVFLSGTVVRGFGRGSKTLGFPTANLESEDVSRFIACQETGIYAGFAKILGVDGIEDNVAFPAAISVGWNPTFTDVKAKVFEVHVVHKFPVDFYGAVVKVAVCQKLREEKAFTSLDDLIKAINEDCDATLLLCASLPQVAAAL